MATGAMGQVVQYLRRVARPLCADQWTDGQLLTAFLSDRAGTSAVADSAFETLVRRHGGMVLAVCGRVLGNVHDAEDAFQATFLILARKAGSIVPREQVGNWLHGVALRTALEARARRARRRARERQVNDMPHPTVSAEVNWEALHRLLDQELNRLPVKYRSALILCELEGRSRKEAARQLGLAEGTLSSRLATGRQMLAHRLLRHGLTLPTAGLAAALGAQATAACVRPALLSATAKAAVLAGSGQAARGLVSAQAISLSQGVLKTMFLYRLKVVTVLLVGMAFGGLGVGAIAVPAQGQAVTRPLVAQGARTTQGQRAEPEEPLDANLLLDEQIQKELRLSKNQIHRLKETVAETDRQNEGVRKEVKEIQKQIAELQKRIQGLNQKMASDRQHALRDAAPKILSPRALARVRQIQRQSRDVAQLLKDPRVQRLLNLDDEQMMKIEKMVKESGSTLHYLEVAGTQLKVDGTIRQLNVMQNTPYLNMLFNYQGELMVRDPRAYAQLADLLTDQQKQALRVWLGEPFRDQQWKWLWPKEAGKDR
jgi:RNA polymerase sigma factor (sigma-70 family)